MLEEWTGEIVGKMHYNKITCMELAKKLGVTKSYVSMILNGSRKPKQANIRLNTAIDEIITARGQSK